MKGQLNNDVNIHSIFISFIQVVEEFHDLPSRFGTAFPINGLRGLATYSKPANACAKIDPPPSYYNSTKVKWIVLISR